MDLGLRQSDVANRIGVWTSTINYWEKNRFNPEVRYVPEIVAFLGYDPFGPPPASFSLQLKGGASCRRSVPEAAGCPARDTSRNGG